MRPNMTKDRQAAEMTNDFFKITEIQATLPGFFFVLLKKCQALEEFGAFPENIPCSVPGTNAAIRMPYAPAATYICC